MFKKRTRPASVRDKPTIEEETSEENAAGPSSQTDDGEAGEEAGRSIEELILLRKFRKSQQGIDLEKLNRGEDKKNKGKKVEDEEGAAAKFGLGKRGDKKGDDDGLGDDGTKRLVRTNNFTQSTNALDVDKHMLAYIEDELLKRRGGAVAEAAERARRGEAPLTKDEYDPQAELFKIAERYRIEQNPKVKKEDEEGNVTSSLGMLTSIPEVDLGMDNRLKNIEETEKAKREMMEHRKAQAVVKKKDEDADFASARFFRPQHRVASDVYIMEDAKREAAGLPPVQKPRYERQNETATDEVVYERFKKRMKK